MTLIKLNNKIVKCRQCDRLVNFREKIASDKRKQYINENYWGRPITGYGDINSQLLMIGLAPAAHGGNRTGRVFTGDKSADFLFKCLHKAGFANQSISISRDDGLELNNLYLTTALKTCFNFFREEINYLVKINTIVALGKIAFDACLNFYMQDYDLKRKDFVFQHGTEYMLPDSKILIGSYHPSPRNVNTGRIDENKMGRLLKKVKKIMDR
jgi:uracil-DNA glycosylase